MEHWTMKQIHPSFVHQAFIPSDGSSQTVTVFLPTPVNKDIPLTTQARELKVLFEGQSSKQKKKGFAWTPQYDLIYLNSGELISTKVQNNDEPQMAGASPSASHKMPGSEDRWVFDTLWVDEIGNIPVFSPNNPNFYKDLQKGINLTDEVLVCLQCHYGWKNLLTIVTRSWLRNSSACRVARTFLGLNAEQVQYWKNHLPVANFEARFLVTFLSAGVMRRKSVESGGQMFATSKKSLGRA